MVAKRFSLSRVPMSANGSRRTSLRGKDSQSRSRLYKFSTIRSLARGYWREEAATTV